MQKSTEIGEVLSDKAPKTNKFPFSISATPFLSKPTESEISDLHFAACEGTLHGLLGLVAKGHTFSCGVFRNNVRASLNLLKQQMFCVDFGGEMSLHEAQLILEEHGLWYNAGYYTFNHSDEVEKFRLMFIFNGEVATPELVKEINLGFHHLFNRKSDKRCIDAARFWIGTNKGYFLGASDALIDMDKFLEVVTPYLLANDRNQWRQITTANRKYRCAETGKLIYEFNKNNQICTTTAKANPDKIKIIDNYQVDDLLHFTLFQRFFNGLGTETKGNKLVHDELVGIASNLIYVSGGSKIWKNCLERNGNYSDEKFSIYNYVKRLNYKPIYFKKFSPYIEDVESFYQTFPQILVKRGKIKQLSPPKKPISLSKARSLLKSKFKDIIKADTHNVYLLKCATGLGKTELIKNINDVVVAFPTHSLKDENFISSGIADSCKISSPEVVGFSEKTQKHFDALYRNGFNEIVYQLITDLSLGKPINDDKLCDPADTEKATAYLIGLKAIKESTNSHTIFTTQHRAVLSTFPQSTLVFDENPLNVLLTQDVVPITDFTRLMAELYMTNNYEIANKLDLCLKSLDKEVFSTPAFDAEEKIIYRLVKKLKIKSKLWGFFKSDYYVKINDKISFCTNNISRLPTDKKIIIADATAPEKLYRKLFGNRLVVVDISNVELKGEVIQYTQFSNSKSGLAQYAEVTKALLDDWTTITYKDQKSLFENSSPTIHWGNAKGTNSLEGQNLNVVGTLHYGLAYYMFLSKVCELLVQNFETTYGKVIYKDLEFSFPTFKDPELRNLHLELVEGDSIQAVHRARPINHEVTVKLYSNMPIPQAKWIWWDTNKPQK